MDRFNREKKFFHCPSFRPFFSLHHHRLSLKPPFSLRFFSGSDDTFEAKCRYDNLNITVITYVNMLRIVQIVRKSNNNNNNINNNIYIPRPSRHFQRIATRTVNICMRTIGGLSKHFLWQFGTKSGRKSPNGIFRNC